MKTMIKLFLATIILLTSTLSVQAQSHLRRSVYGDFFGGMTLASMDMKGGNEYKKNRLGYMIGGNINYRFLGYMELQSGFQILKKGSLKHQQTEKPAVSGRTEKADIKDVVDANYIQIPLNIGFEIPVAKELFLNAHVGVFAAYGFKGRATKKGYEVEIYEGRPPSESDKIKYNRNVETFSNEYMSRWDYGIGANVGLVYDIYVLRAQYDHGLANVATDALFSEWKTRNFSLCFGFRF